jgi:hypothetical protein
MLRSNACVVVVIWVGVLAGRAVAADPPAGKGIDQVLPELSFTDVSLEDLTLFLQDVNPAFKALVVRDPDAPADFPQLRMRLKNVTTKVFLDVLMQAYSDLEITKVGPADQPVYVIKVHAPRNAPAAAAAGGRGGVKVYRLSNALGSVLNNQGIAMPADPKARVPVEKAALDHVLSLVKAALAQAGGTGPVLQVHEETQTLIFKGSVDQRAAVEDALSALGVNIPPDNSESAALRREVDQWRSRLEEERARAAERSDLLQKQTEEMRMRARESEVEASQRAVELERLKVRLEQMQEKLKLLNIPAEKGHEK